MIEVTYSEELLLPASNLKLLHSYEDELSASIMTYSLDEIILEKFRAILQQTKKLHERTWSRSRARDYYDLWHIFCLSKYYPKSNGFLDLLTNKCRPKEVVFQKPNDFFSPILIKNVTNTWEHWIGNLMKDLPPVEQVIDELKEVVNKLFTSSNMNI